MRCSKLKGVPSIPVVFGRGPKAYVPGGAPGTAGTSEVPSGGVSISAAPTKPYEFIAFGVMDVPKPYEFIGFVTKPRVLWNLC